jgi:hypothetical protein
MGNFVYRLPAPHELVGVPRPQLGLYETMTFTLTVSAMTLGGVKTLACKSESNCKVVFHRHYTPTFYYLTPPVVYYEAVVELNFRPYSVWHLVNDGLPSDEMQFINGKVDTALIDFNEFKESVYTTNFRHWTDY